MATGACEKAAGLFDLYLFLNDMNCVHKKYTCVYESVENVLLSFFVDVQKFSFSFHCTIRGSLLFRDVFFAIDVFGRYHIAISSQYRLYRLYLIFIMYHQYVQ